MNKPDPAAVVIVTRHPDYENDFATYGSVRVVDVDLGSSFDGEPDSIEQAREWAQGFEETALELEQAGHADAAASLRNTIGEVVAGVVAPRLEELRAVIREERISYGEIAELQSLAPYIGQGDVELLEWAGVTEEQAREEGRI